MCKGPVVDFRRGQGFHRAAEPVAQQTIFDESRLSVGKQRKVSGPLAKNPSLRVNNARGQTLRFLSVDVNPSVVKMIQYTRLVIDDALPFKTPLEHGLCAFFAGTQSLQFNCSIM